jgi:hypothetical protein
VEDHFETWSRFSLVGLILTGLGLSVIGQATISKAKGHRWFLQGTLGLIIFNTGLALFGESVKARALYEAELDRFRHAPR